jgi:PiT family inorganic phosphate transporter
VIGMTAGVIVTALTSWVVRRQSPLRVDRWFRRLQLVSAGAFSFSHGTNDAQKSMGIITAALVTGGVIPSYRVPDWVIICCALAMAGGTMAGGWRVVKTMGQKITKLNPFGGFAAETSAALTLIGTAAAGIPVSSTHVITGAISGVGASRRMTAVRWGVTRQIVWAWVLTIPGAGFMGALFHFLFLNWVQ